MCHQHVEAHLDRGQVRRPSPPALNRSLCAHVLPTFIMLRSGAVYAWAGNKLRKVNCAFEYLTCTHCRAHAAVGMEEGPCRDGAQHVLKQLPCCEVLMMPFICFLFSRDDRGTAAVRTEWFECASTTANLCHRWQPPPSASIPSDSCVA